MPGEQKPHCTAPSSARADCSRCGASKVPSASMVVIARPWAWKANTWQAFTVCPSMITVHAPHTPSSQPTFTPLHPSRRSRAESFSSG